jgi:hypothetical protein
MLCTTKKGYVRSTKVCVLSVRADMCVHVHVHVHVQAC